MLPRWFMVPVTTLGLQAADGGTDKADGLNSALDAASAVGLDVITLFDRGASVMGRRLLLATRRNRTSSLPLFVRKWSSRRPAAMSEGTRSRSWKRVVSTSATSLNASLTLGFSLGPAQHAPDKRGFIT